MTSGGVNTVGRDAVTMTSVTMTSGVVNTWVTMTSGVVSTWGREYCTVSRDAGKPLSADISRSGVF